MKSKNDTEKFYTQFLQTVEKFIPESYFQKHLSQSTSFDLFKNPQFQELLNHSPAIVGVFNHVHMGYEFISDNIEAITGYSPELFKGANGMEQVLSTFTKEHAILYNGKVFPILFELYQTYSTSQELKKIRFTASFQLAKKDGSVIWCMQQLNVIETDEQGFPLLSLLFMSDISHVKKDSGIDVVISKKDGEDVFQTFYATTFFTEEHIIHFTKRELEILQLLSKGMSSIDISKLLGITENTVNTHRQNMLEKSDKKNTAELLSFVLGKGFIK